MKILVLGRNGQVGSELVRLLRPLVEVVATGRDELDLAEPDRLAFRLRELRPDLVINAAAHTAVDRAEEEPDEALAVNARAPGILGEEARRLGIGVIHYSTDYVFDGTKGEPYLETDPTSPLNVYGRTKRLGERALEGSGAAHLTLRVGWVYSRRRGSFLTKMLALMTRRRILQVVDDELGTPTWARDIAGATVAVLESMAGSPGAWTSAGVEGSMRERGGMFHLSPAGHTSWHGFAEEIRRQAATGPLAPLRVQQVLPIPASEWPSAARRPKDSRLSSARLAREAGLALPDWRIGVSSCVAELAASRALLPA